MPFDHERLDVYRAAIEPIAWAADLLERSPELRRFAGAKHLDDASQSIANNIAEGNGKRSLVPSARSLAGGFLGR
jgi:hypothetical protein